MNITTLPNGDRKLVLRQSDFKTYMVCGREFYLGVVRELEPAQRKASVADVGTFVHVGLQTLYKNGDGVEASIAKATNEAIEENPILETDLHKSARLAQVMVAGYIEWLETEAEDHGRKTIAVEERYETYIGTYHGVQVWVTTQIDHLVEDENGDLIIDDHKTVDQFAGMAEVLDIDFQGMTYDFAIYKNTGRYPKKFEHNQLRRVLRTGTAKPPFYKRHPVEFNAQQRERHVWALEGLAEEVVRKALSVEGLDSTSREVNTLFRPLPTKDCRWRCDFLKTARVCPMMSYEPEGAEEMLQSSLFKLKERVN
jgi:hypothetical protein